MRRRRLLAGASGAGIASPFLLVSRARGQAALRRVAILLSSTASDPEGQARLASLREGLAQRGWVEGRTIQLDVHYGGAGAQAMRDQAAAMVASAPDLIVLNSTPALDDVVRRTRTIPIVFVLAVDPVALGEIQSVAHPGGNITGFTFWDVTLVGKWLQLLREAVPSLEHAVVIHNPDSTPFYRQMMEAAGRMPGLPPLSLSVAPMHEARDIEPVVKEIARRPNSAVIAPSDPFLTRYRQEIATALLAARLPSVSIFRIFAEAGWLMSYGPDVSNVFKRSAGYIDRILRGARPGDLPAQEPTLYQFVINGRAARALGLALPPTLQVRADETLD
ncbi:MAG: ABC transporter substrate-binding protein [Proteobacteria bacterium]|nr:ABC transporter substrate-binding protein [Pseudomonadota bacterium]